MKRIDKLTAKMKEEGYSTLIVTDKHSIKYLTGEDIEPGERLLALIVRPGKKPTLIINKLFLRKENKNLKYKWISDTDDKIDVIGEELSGNYIGVDKNMEAKILLPLLKHDSYRKFSVGSELVDNLRAVKDEEEIKLMEEASVINDKAMAMMKEELSKRKSELQMAEKLIDFYRELGSEEYSFEPIIAYGVNASDPHHENDHTLPKAGDTMVVDMGCIYKDYCSDMTRTFFYKEVPEEGEKIYNIVRKANETAISIIKPGVLLKDIDKAARDVITEAGYGEYFTHRTGHFIGIDVHELPDVSQSSDVVAEEGMIFSVEPGIYVPGGVGVRIEDLVLVTKDGCKVLNSYPKDIQIVK